ncbi:hypothetical protein EV1_021815 [Malus domestica]
MLAKESGSSEFDLPEEVLELLPSDPLEQLDVARKIRSLTLSTRPDHSRPPIPGGVPRRLSLRDRRQTRPRDEEKEGLVKERAVLSNTEEAEQRCIEAGGVQKDAYFCLKFKPTVSPQLRPTTTLSDSPDPLQDHHT